MALERAPLMTEPKEEETVEEAEDPKKKKNLKEAESEPLAEEANRLFIGH